MEYSFEPNDMLVMINEMAKKLFMFLFHGKKRKGKKLAKKRLSDKASRCSAHEYHLSD